MNLLMVNTMNISLSKVVDWIDFAWIIQENVCIALTVLVIYNFSFYLRNRSALVVSNKSLFGGQL